MFKKRRVRRKKNWEEKEKRRRRGKRKIIFSWKVLEGSVNFIDLIIIFRFIHVPIFLF